MPSVVTLPTVNAANFKFVPSPMQFWQGYMSSASLAGAYSGFNPLLMHNAGMWGGFCAMWSPVNK